MGKNIYLYDSDYIDEISSEINKLQVLFNKTLNNYIDKLITDLDTNTIAKLEKFNGFKIDFVFTLPPILAIFVSKKFNLDYLRCKFRNYLYSIDFKSKYLPIDLILIYNDIKIYRTQLQSIFFFFFK